MAKIRFGKKDTLFEIPTIDRLPKTPSNECLFILGTDLTNTKYKMCFGVGKVYGVEHGKDLDVVKLNFGAKFHRIIYVKDNRARRQIYTLKKGQYASFLGKIRMVKDNDTFKTIMFASGFQAWYVPKMLDIKNYDLDSIDEMEKENETSMLTFLDDIIKGDNDED